MALRRYLPGLAVAGALLAAVALAWAPPLRCMSQCYVDLEEVHGPALGLLELQDTRLNTWILGWVQRSLVTDPRALFNGNALYPAPHSISGSEHLIGVAVLTLPLRLFSSDPVFLHQAALVLSSLLIGLCTAALVRWLTGAHWIAAGAGLVAIFMPWRAAELSHIQILSAHWIPLIWLGVLRQLVERPRPREGVALGAVLALQLLSSFYVAYFVTLSIALIGFVVVLRAGWRPRALGRLALVCSPGYALLILTSLPYLARESRGELLTSVATELPSGFGNITAAARLLWPRLDPLSQQSAGVDPSYFVPLAVAALALATLALSRLLRSAPANIWAARMRLAVPALWVVAAGAFAMSIGSELRMGELRVPLPAGWAEAFVPGFANLRGPHRWHILIGIAMPVLAGVAVAAGASELRRAASNRLRVLSLLGLAVMLALSLPLRTLPAKPVWEHPARIESTYAALRELPPGPVLEIPWHTNPLLHLRRDPQYLLASTRHWRPLANGFTGYLPPSFYLLRRVAHHLPAPEALDSLRRLAGVRWIVVHRDALDDGARKAWDAAVERGDLVRSWSTWHTHILEIPATEEAGVWLDDLRSPERRERSLAGVARAPLALEMPAGEMQAQLPTPRGFRNIVRFPATLELTVKNASERDWPGLDVQKEGLVMLRYAFVDEENRVVRRSTAFLDADLPAGKTTRALPLLTLMDHQAYAASVLRSRLLETPAVRGRYRLCVDLVQQRGRDLIALPVAPVELDVSVLGLEASLDTGGATPCDAPSLRQVETDTSQTGS